MPLKIRYFLLPSLALCLMSPQAVAQGEAGPKLKLDTNQNGLVEISEFVAGADERFAQMDQNSDGQITREEHKAFMQAKHAKRRAKHFAKLDANNDGVISKDEFDAGGPKPGHFRRHRRHGPPPEGMMPHHMESDHIGAEAKSGSVEKPAMDKATFEARARQRFARMDKNGDGALDPSEFRRPHRR